MKGTGLEPAAVNAAARLVGDADALLVCAGAGMGVDSGLPDFRGDTGFWKAYPPYARLGLGFMDLADPAHFTSDPELAWGFYGHRLGLYRATKPHAGFAILRSWGERIAHGVRVFTSNVDGQFLRAGFGGVGVVEAHGSIHHLQCLEPCSDDVWPADGVEVEVDEATMRAAPPLPRCRHCGGLARPNILMFGDWTWMGKPADAQEQELDSWLRRLARANGRLAVVELGAGKAIPTVRLTAQRIAAAAGGRRSGGALIRINPDPAAATVPPGAGVALRAGALAALTAIDAQLRSII
jgi:NAD-dependent SIR2 family protein deacetylase